MVFCLSVARQGQSRHIPSLCAHFYTHLMNRGASQRGWAASQCPLVLVRQLEQVYRSKSATPDLSGDIFP